MESSIFAIFLLGAVLFANAYEIKLTYNWSATITAGSLLPLEHLAKYQLSADLAVYITDKYIFQVENLTTPNLYANLDLLSLPFGAAYRDDGVQFYKYTDHVSERDEVWSLNMKKSLAALFQLKRNTIEEGAFTIKENNTYGTCDVEYIAVKSNSTVQITKLINELSCSNSPDKRRSNTPFFVCPSNFQEGVANHNERTYTLFPEKGPFIEEISSVGTLHFQPFQALAEAHYIHVNQTLQLVSIQNNTDLPTFNPSLVPNDIRYTSEAHHEPTSGRIPSNQTLLIEEIYELLENLTDSLNWELSMKDLDNQTSFRILELMLELDMQDWEKLYENISVGTSYTQETIQHFFWDLIPQVGSEASIVFIKNLVTSKKVSGFTASHMLITFPLHVKQVTEKFLVELEDFLHLRDVDVEIRDSGILCFATLVHKACREQCAVELLDRYTKYFLDKFMETANYQDRMVYLQALSNMQLARILDFLSPIISNPSYDRHTRYMAIWCTMSAIEKNRQKAAEIFWPIFINVTEPLEIRVSAMSVLMITQPSASRLLTFFWHMQKEPNYHLYNYFYTTIHSYANTKYPCYHKIGHIASQLSRYLLPRAYRWATGNYILDYEDSVRGYGGLIHFIIIASENTGLPSNFYVSTEHHSHGLSSKFSLFVKLEGVADVVLKTLDMNHFANVFQTMNITRFLYEHDLNVKKIEPVHVEIMLKIDGNTLYCKYFNQTSLLDMLLAIKKASALYYEFSVNYQRVRFPLRYEAVKFTDLGTPAALQIRTASVLSLRGRIQQAESGKNRNAELDFRYSLDTVTSLKTFNPFNKEWYGTDRMRSLHARIPFSTHLFEKVSRSVFEITANRHKDFVDGSLLGFVWHSTIKQFPSGETIESPRVGNDTDTSYWSVESRDLGARFDAKKFDCQGENDILDTLFIIKEAFQLSNKNYKMVIGGVPILGLYSLVNYFTFLPPGDRCGIIISMAPLKVQLALLSEGNILRLTMRTEKEEAVIWDLNMRYKETENEGTTTIDFRLVHSNSEKNFTIMNGSWRLIQFEGTFSIPSYRQGILNAPSPAEGHAKLAWGDANQATSIELDLHSDNTAKNWPMNCENDTAACLQVVSNLATKQTVMLNCINLPIWVTTALLSVFPDNVQADKKSTKIQFSIPAKVPWTTQGVCVINNKSVLNFDNATVLEYKQQSHCYSIAAAECSSTSQFVIGIKKVDDFSDTLELKVISTFVTLTVSAIKNETLQILSLNDTSIPVTTSYQLYPSTSTSDASNFLFKFKFWEKSKMIEIVVGQSGLLIQYYGQSVVAIASSNLRGTMCGLCGDFNGEISNDSNIISNSCVADFKVY